MKKVVFFSALLIFFGAHAQHGKVVSSYRFLEDYYSTNDTTSLIKAQVAIDLATKDESTKDEAKTWLYRAKIYHAIFDRNFIQRQASYSNITNASQKVMLSYQSVNIDPLIVATDAYFKAKELDVKKIYEEDITPKLNECVNHFGNKGIAEYNVQHLNEALPMFEKSMQINTALGRSDTLDLYNAAQIADMLKDHEKAKTYYLKLIAAKAGKPESYRRLANVYAELKDPVNQIDIIKKGRTRFPKDNDLLTDEINYYLASSNPDDMQNTINTLKQSLEKNPNDKQLNLTLGNVYDRLANPVDGTGKRLVRPTNADELFKNSETYYKKAVEVSPNDFDALFFLGALYVNKGSHLLDIAMSIDNNSKSEKISAEADEVFKQSLPYLEKAVQINGSDYKLLDALKRLYARLEMTDKLKVVNEKLKTLK